MALTELFTPGIFATVTGADLVSPEQRGWNSFVARLDGFAEPKEPLCPEVSALDQAAVQKIILVMRFADELMYAFISSVYVIH